MIGRVSLIIACTALLAACDPEEEAPMCPGEPMFHMIDAPTEATPGATISMEFHVENFEFSMEGGHDEGDEGHGADPGDEPAFRAAEHEYMHGDSGCIIGHVHVYLDDLMTNPLAQLTHSTGEVTLPAELMAGDEITLIGRLHDAGHLIIEPQVTLEHEITIQ